MAVLTHLLLKATDDLDLDVGNLRQYRELHEVPIVKRSEELCGGLLLRRGLEEGEVVEQELTLAISRPSLVAHCEVAKIK